MAHLLKQSTAYTFRLGPFLDSTDGNTQENALTIAAADVLLSKAGGALTAKNEATALTGTGANAHYTCILNTTDTGTLGTLRVWSHITGALAVWQDFMVLPANVYDSLVAGSDVLDVSATQLAGQVITAAAGVTFPTSIASPTNITAATGIVLSGVTHTGAVIPTVTTVTNDVGITQVGADKAWLTATRILTAGTNIVLAKGVGVTGFNDLSAAQVNTEADTAIVDARLDELLAADSDIDGLTPPTVGSVFHELMTKTVASFTYDQTTDSLEALRDRGDAAWITATGFSTHSAADVWAVATRVLTAGTNIVLAKGTGVTGFNDLSSGDAATAIWNAATATYGSAGSYGLLVETNLDAAITSRSSHTAANVWSVATRALTDKVDFSILAANRATLVDEIWDEDVDITHQTAGTAGKKLDDAGGAADPWGTALPGAYGAGTAGNILGNRLVGTIATGTHNPQSGDAYAIVNNGTYGNSAIKTDTAATLLDTGTDGVVIKSIDQDYTETGTAQAGAANTITLAAGANSINDLWVGQQISIYAGTGAGQTRGVLNYNGTTKVLTVARNWKINPDVTSKYKIQLWFGPKVNNSLEVSVANAGADLTAIPWNATWDAEVQSECADALIAYDGVVPADLPANFAAMSISVTTGLVDITQTAADKVWSSATRTLTSFGTLIADIWGYSSRTLTAFSTTLALSIWDVLESAIATASSIGVKVKTNLDAAITTRSSHTAADTWTVATRALTDKTGFSLTQAFPTNFALLSIDGSGYVTEVNVDGIKKNTALNNFEFLMVDATDGYTEETGLSVTATRSIDGAAFGACANAVTEVASGMYKINLAAADLNGDVITLRFTATGARTRVVTIKTNS